MWSFSVHDATQRHIQKDSHNYIYVSRLIANNTLEEIHYFQIQHLNRYVFRMNRISSSRTPSLRANMPPLRHRNWSGIQILISWFPCKCDHYNIATGLGLKSSISCYPCKRDTIGHPIGGALILDILLSCKRATIALSRLLWKSNFGFMDFHTSVLAFPHTKRCRTRTLNLIFRASIFVSSRLRFVSGRCNGSTLSRKAGDP